MATMKVKITASRINSKKKDLDARKKRLETAKRLLKDARETADFWERQVGYAQRDLQKLKKNEGKYLMLGKSDTYRRASAKFAMDKAKRKRKSKSK